MKSDGPGDFLRIGLRADIVDFQYQKREATESF